MGRPREHDEATRERLLAAAARLSGDEGWSAVSIRRVATEAGTTTRAVYSLFDSKQGLEEALHTALFERLLELIRATPQSGDPRADLLALGLAYRRWATERPERYAAMMRFVGPQAATRSPEGLAAARAVSAELRAAINRCAEARLVAEADVEALAIQWRAVGHGLAEFENRGLLPDAEPAWGSALSALVDAFARRAAA